MMVGVIILVGLFGAWESMVPELLDQSKDVCPLIMLPLVIIVRALSYKSYNKWSTFMLKNKCSNNII